MVESEFLVSTIFQCSLYICCFFFQLLTEVIPDYEPNPPMVNVKYTGPLVEPLNEMLPPEEVCFA